jgi:hypothetical protein
MRDESGDRAHCQALIASFLGCQPTLIGKLAYCAALRDNHTGGYHHNLLEAVGPPTLISSLLRVAHRDLLVRWLALDSVEQHWDVKRFFVFDGSPQFMEHCVQHDLFRRLIPEDIWGQEHALFLCQVYGAIESIELDKEEIDSPKAPLTIESVR